MAMRSSPLSARKTFATAPAGSSLAVGTEAAVGAWDRSGRSEASKFEARFSASPESTGRRARVAMAEPSARLERRASAVSPARAVKSAPASAKRASRRDATACSTSGTGAMLLPANPATIPSSRRSAPPPPQLSGSAMPGAPVSQSFCQRSLLNPSGAALRTASVGHSLAKNAANASCIACSSSVNCKRMAIFYEQQSLWRRRRSIYSKAWGKLRGFNCAGLEAIFGILSRCAS